MMRWCVWMSLGAGCVEGGGSGPAGTSVGNPTEMVVRVADSIDVVLDQAELPLREVVVTYTDGTWQAISVDRTLDVLAGDPFTIPAGQWQSLVLTTDAPMTLSGQTGPTGDPADLVLDVTDIVLVARVARAPGDTEAHVVELASPGWLDGDAAGFDPTGPVTVAPGDAVHDHLALTLRETTTVFADDDGDGQVDDAERSGGDQGGGGRGS